MILSATVRKPEPSFEPSAASSLPSTELDEPVGAVASVEEAESVECPEPTSVESVTSVERVTSAESAAVAVVPNGSSLLPALVAPAGTLSVSASDECRPDARSESPAPAALAAPTPAAPTPAAPADPAPAEPAPAPRVASSCSTLRRSSARTRSSFSRARCSAAC
ncbi:hypothetical protein EAH86_15420 [Pedococcus bigeumensis]|uniref:Uncharacterized protein n=1 Tax=Pedococcus bigeumensis TaxID=433644 RepID=A0A502CS40_9MICO|nr:hypothetical protein EAH86_15420 [Pedococcus bigeumensis]